MPLTHIPNFSYLCLLLLPFAIPYVGTFFMAETFSSKYLSMIVMPRRIYTNDALSEALRLLLVKRSHYRSISTRVKLAESAIAGKNSVQEERHAAFGHAINGQAAA